MAVANHSFQYFLFLLLLSLFRLHVCVNVLHVVELLKTFNHLVDGSTLLSVKVLKVVRYVCELATDIFEALLLEELLYLCVSLYVVTIDSDCALLVVLVKLVLYVEVDKLKDKLFHIYAVLLLKSEHTLVVEEVRKRTCCTECTIELVEHRANVAYSTCSVVGKCVNEDSDAMRAISLVCYFLVLALVFTHCVLDSTLDVVFRHILTLTCSDDRTE